MSEYPTLQVREVTKSENAALKATWAGEATPYQQKVAIGLIVNAFARANDELYIPDHSDQTTFMLGRAFVGQQILKHLKVPVGKLNLQNDDNEESES